MSGIEIWLPLILVFILLAIRIPVCMAFIGGAVFYFGFIATEMPLNMILSKMVSAGMNMNLMAIPFFHHGGTADELYRHHLQDDEVCRPVRGAYVGRLSPGQRAAVYADGRIVRLFECRRCDAVQDAGSGDGGAWF